MEIVVLQKQKEWLDRQTVEGSGVAAAERAAVGGALGGGCRASGWRFKKNRAAPRRGDAARSEARR